MGGVTCPMGESHGSLEGGLTLLGEFQDRGLEETFRRQQEQRDFRLMAITASVICVTVLSFAGSDWRLYAASATFWLLFAGRCLVVFATLATIYVLGRVRAHQGRDRVLVIWAFAVIGFVLVVAAIRPREYVTHAVMDVAVVLLAYLVMPLPLRLQALLSLTLTLGNVAILAVLKRPADALAIPLLMTSFAVANLMGALASWEVQRHKRRLFAAVLQERDLRQELEKALREVKTLRGMVPICAGCKRIRDGEGSWHDVETFVRDRTHAQFTHGICPQCSTTFCGAFAR